MSLIDIGLLGLGLLAGMGAFLSGRDTLYKLFLGLIIGFLAYLVVAYQLELVNLRPEYILSPYENFISEHQRGVLTLMLVSVPLLGIFFMLHPRITIETRPRSLSHIFLGLLLPLFLIGILANLSSSSLLSNSQSWLGVFDFLSQSALYNMFLKYPGLIFVLLGFLIFYKSLFLLILAFLSWLYHDVILEFF